MKKRNRKKYIPPRIDQIDLDSQQAVLTACRVGFGAFIVTNSNNACYAYTAPGTRYHVFCLNPVGRSGGTGATVQTDLSESAPS